MPSSDKTKQKLKIKGSESNGEKRGSTAKAAMARALARVSAVVDGGARTASSNKGPTKPGGAAKAARSAAANSASASKGLRARKAGDR